MRANLPVLAALGVLLPLASGCGPSGGRSSNPDGGVTINIATAEPAKNAVSTPLGRPAAPEPKPNVVAPPPANAQASVGEKPDLSRPTAKPMEAVSTPPARPQADDEASAPKPPKPQAPAEPPAVSPPRSTNLPLPNAVVARTIERIGYACGQVTSSSAVEGAGGPAYKITCSSGASYRASTVAGHLRFRKWEQR